MSSYQKLLVRNRPGTCHFPGGGKNHRVWPGAQALHWLRVSCRMVFKDSDEKQSKEYLANGLQLSMVP